jgi:hypothetical protein
MSRSQASASCCGQIDVVGVAKTLPLFPIGELVNLRLAAAMRSSSCQQLRSEPVSTDYCFPSRRLKKLRLRCDGSVLGRLDPMFGAPVGAACVRLVSTVGTDTRSWC